MKKALALERGLWEGCEIYLRSSNLQVFSTNCDVLHFISILVVSGIHPHTQLDYDLLTSPALFRYIEPGFCVCYVPNDHNYRYLYHLAQLFFFGLHCWVRLATFLSCFFFTFSRIIGLAQPERFRAARSFLFLLCFTSSMEWNILA